MAELLATGPGSGESDARALVEGVPLRVGRSPQADWPIAWDRQISREHIEVMLRGGELMVRRLPSARNPVLLGTEERDEFRLRAGETFSIGQTQFAFREESPITSVELGDRLLAAHSFHSGELRSVRILGNESQLEALSALPGVLRNADSSEELAEQIVGLVLKGLPAAAAVAVVAYDSPEAIGSQRPFLMRWKGRDDRQSFRPSRRLLRRALEEKGPQVYVWSDVDVEATTVDGVTWAFCVPFTSDACPGWCLYAKGGHRRDQPLTKLLSPEALTGDVRFAELVTEFVDAAREARRLERKQAEMNQFFSPAVLKTISRESMGLEALKPRETDITVLFCDVRGFSKKSEESQHDLHSLLERVSQALGVMTRGIVSHDGIISDFQGDAALGFWGWPSPSDGALDACRTALAIQAEFRKAARNPEHALAGFKIGIGIAHGRAIAGRIGTEQQAKVGVFGPVVNLGSRLDGLTKLVRAPILMDETTARQVEEQLPRTQGRCRRLGKIRPYGMSTVLTISELLPPVSDLDSISDEDLARFDRAVDALEGRDWDLAMELLGQLPFTDRVKDFLTIYIAQNHYEPPADWDGVIQMHSK